MLYIIIILPPLEPLASCPRAGAEPAGGEVRDQGEAPAKVLAFPVEGDLPDALVLLTLWTPP